MLNFHYIFGLNHMFGRSVPVKKSIETFKAVNIRFDAEIDVEKIAAIYKKNFDGKITGKQVHDYRITNESSGFGGYEYAWVVDHDLVSDFQIKHSYVNGVWRYAPYGTQWRKYPLALTNEVAKILHQSSRTESGEPTSLSLKTWVSLGQAFIWVGVGGVELPGVEGKVNNKLDITLLRYFFADNAWVGLTYLAIKKFTPAMEKMLEECGFKYRCLVHEYDGKKEYLTLDELRERRSALDMDIPLRESKLNYHLHDTNIAEICKNIGIDFANQYCEAHEFYNDVFTLTVKVQVHEKLIV